MRPEFDTPDEHRKILEAIRSRGIEGMYRWYVNFIMENREKV
jgi:hypothetical protein